MLWNYFWETSKKNLVVLKNGLRIAARRFLRLSVSKNQYKPNMYLGVPQTFTGGSTRRLLTSTRQSEYNHILYLEEGRNLLTHKLESDQKL